MAKRARTTGKSTGEVIGGFAEDLGKLLGQARNKAEGWLGQRQAIVKQLTQLRDEANTLLGQLAGGGARMAAAVGISRRGRPVGSKNKKSIIIVGGRKRRTMSAKARAAISAAQKARWAKQKAAKRNK